MTTKRIEKRRAKRQFRVRAKVRGTAARPRLSVFRSALHIYVQAIDDEAGRTLAAASTLTPDLRAAVDKVNKTEAAREVGKFLCRRLREQGVGQVVFDRGRFLYHGRVKALAEGAREAGLGF